VKSNTAAASIEIWPLGMAPVCSPDELLAQGVDCSRDVWLGLGIFFLIVSLCCCIVCGFQGDKIWGYVYRRITGKRPGSQQTPEVIDALEDPSPDVLHVRSPNRRKSCAGEYVRVAGKRPNGHPLWRLKSGDRWLYSGRDSRWYIGGESAKAQDFNCSTGFICQALPHCGSGPHEAVGPWQWGTVTSGWVQDPHIAVFSKQGDSLVDEKSYDSHNIGENDGSCTGTSTTASGPQVIRSSRTGHREVGRGSRVTCCLVTSSMQSAPSEVSSDHSVMSEGYMSDQQTAPVELGIQAPPQVLCVNSPNGQRECVGEYDLVLDEYANGLPLWKQRNGKHWLYSSLSSRWCIGGPDVQQDNFARSAGYISQAAVHKGLMPDRVFQTWQRWDGKKSVRDCSVTIISEDQQTVDGQVVINI